MIGIVAGLAVGILGHQTDRVFRKLERGNTPPVWTLLGRYGIGILLVIITMALMLKERDNDRADVVLKTVTASVSVGLGVSAGHLLDHLAE